MRFAAAYFFIAFLLTAGISGVIADETVCFASEIGSAYSFTDSSHQIYGYSLLDGFADDERYLYFMAWKTTTDQVIFKLDPENSMNLVATYDIDESAISNKRFGKITFSNESGTPRIYGYNDNEHKLYEYNISTSVTSVKFSTFDAGSAFVSVQDIAINKDGDSTDTPTELLVTGYTGITFIPKIYSCTWENSPTCTLKKTLDHQYYSRIDFQQDDANQEVITAQTESLIITNYQHLYLRSFDYSAYDNVVSKTYSAGYDANDRRIKGVAHVQGSVYPTDSRVYVAQNGGSTHTGMIVLRTFDPCETIDAGVFVSVDEFDNANYAKAVNEGTQWATFDDSALLGWEAYSFANTLADFDGEYSTDASNWVNIAGLQAIGDADEGYVIADFGELFDTTTYKDAGNTTANWDTGNAQVTLNTETLLTDNFNSYDTSKWESPQPPHATIVSDDLVVTSSNLVTKNIDSNAEFEYVTFESNIKFTNDQPSTQYSMTGFFGGSGTGYAVLQSESLSTTFKFHTNDGASTTSTTITDTMDTSYHDIKIVRSAADIKLYYDDVLRATHTTNLPTGSLNALYQIRGDTGDTVNNAVDSMSIIDYAASQKITTLTLDDTASIISKFNFAANETTPTNTDVTYDVTCDGGSNWENDITEETVTSCAVNGSDLRVRANLTTTDGDETPILSNFGINYTTDGSDPTNPSVFGTNYFSYVWDTSSIANGEYYFQMTATDDDSPANEDDAYSQPFTICHGDTIQAYEIPDLTTDIYTSITCTNEIEVTRNDATDIMLKIVNQDTNEQDIHIVVSNTTDNNGHYYFYECTDANFNSCVFNSSVSYGDETAGNGLKTWTGSTFTHRISDTWLASETKYILLEYREPYYSVEMNFDADAEFVTFYGDEEFDVNSTGCSSTQPCSHVQVTAANNWQTKSSFDLTAETAIIRFTAWTDAAASKEIEVAFEQLDGIQEFTTMDTITVTNIPQTYTSWLGGVGICEDGNECKINIKTNETSGVYNLYIRDVFIEPDNYFVQLTHLLNADYTQLNAWLYGGESRKYVNEGVPFRVDSEFYDTFGELASYKVEAFVSTDSSGTAELTGLERNFTLTPTIETFYDVDYLTDGVISQDSDYDYMRVVVTVYDSELTAKEMQTQYVQFHNYPFFENDVILTAIQRNRGKNTSPAGTVTMQITQPDTLNAIKIATCEGKTQQTLVGIQNCIDNAKVITEFIKDQDFTCNGNTCIFEFEQSNYAFETLAFYTTIAYADLKTCSITTCGGTNYINGLSIYRIEESDSHAEVSFELPFDNVIHPANYGVYSTYGNYMGNWNAGALIPTDYRLNLHAILYLDSGDYDFTKYVNARMRVLTTGEVVESPEFYPLKTSYDYDQKTGHYWFSTILYDTSGNFFTDSTNHLIEVSFSDDSDKAFTGLISVQNPVTFDDNATVALDSEIELLKFLSFASLGKTSFMGNNYIKNVNMADEVVFTIHNENSTFDDQKTDRQNQFNRFTIPAYVLAELPADYNLTVSEFQEKTAEITSLDLQYCVDSLEYGDPILIYSDYGHFDARLLGCWAGSVWTGFTYGVGSMTKPVTDAIQFTGFTTSFSWRVDGFNPYDYNVLQKDYSDIAKTDINSKIDELRLNTGQGDITLKVGSYEFTQTNNLVYGSTFSGSAIDANSTVETNTYNITVKLVYDDFRDSKSITSRFGIDDSSLNEETDCFSLTHLERGDTLSCLLNAVVSWTLNNLVLALFLVFLFFSVGWFVYQVK